MKNSELLSIIVPFYNVESYLKKCIDSIVNQTYRNLQIILVDDGSTDSSLEICMKYKEQDNRIEILQKENAGLVSARKAGIKMAKGEFVGWVDGDDWVELDYFEKMMKKQEETMADIVAASHFHDIGSSSHTVNNEISNGVYNPKDILSKMLYSGIFFEYGITPQLYTKIIRRDILEKTQMQVDERIICGEDAAVVYPSILLAQRICVTDICGYHYIQHQGSITKVENEDDRERILILIEYLERQFEKSGVLDKLEPQLSIYKNYLWALRKIEIFDEKVLYPFGGIPHGSKIIIYGAGVLGQRIYNYLMRERHLEIVKWLDQNWENYINSGINVESPKTIQKLESEYDYLLIANISQTIAYSIKKYLVEELDVKEDKILWFSRDFYEGKFYQ